MFLPCTYNHLIITDGINSTEIWLKYQQMVFLGRMQLLFFIDK